MRKYWAYWRNTILGTVTYRGGLFLWLLGNLLNLVTFTSFWLATGASKLGGYSRPELVTYYIFATLLWWIVGWHCFWNVREAIRDGSIATNALTKPSSYYWQMFFRELGWHTVGTPIGLGTAILLLIVLRNYLVIPTVMGNLVPLLLSLVLATLLIFSLNFCLGLLTFWFMETQSFSHFIWAGIAVFGGQAIPISFIPGLWHEIIIFAPFRYMASFPLEILFNRPSSLEVLQGFLIGSIWLLIFSLLDQFIWQRGTRIYSSFGG